MITPLSSNSRRRSLVLVAEGFPRQYHDFLKDHQVSGYEHQSSSPSTLLNATAQPHSTSPSSSAAVRIASSTSTSTTRASETTTIIEKGIPTTRITHYPKIGDQTINRMTHHYPAHVNAYLANYCFDNVWREAYHWRQVLRSMTVRKVKEAKREGLTWKGMDEYLERYQMEDYMEIHGPGEACKTLGVPLEVVDEEEAKGTVGRFKERRR